MINVMDQEMVWNMVCGPNRSREDVLREADSSGITPQSWLADAIRLANMEGAQLDAADALSSLCEQCDIACG